MLTGESTVSPCGLQARENIDHVGWYSEAMAWNTFRGDGCIHTWRIA